MSKEQIRGFAPTGMMECWPLARRSYGPERILEKWACRYRNIGRPDLKRWKITKFRSQVSFLNPIFHHSSIPLFHRSTIPIFHDRGKTSCLESTLHFYFVLNVPKCLITFCGCVRQLLQDVLKFVQLAAVSGPVPFPQIFLGFMVIFQSPHT